MESFNFNEHLEGLIDRRRTETTEAERLETERRRLIPELRATIPRFIDIAARHDFPGAVELVRGPTRGWKIYGAWAQPSVVQWELRSPDMVHFAGSISVLGIDGSVYMARIADYDQCMAYGGPPPIGPVCGPRIPTESMSHEGIVATLSLIANVIVRNSLEKEWE